MPEPPLSEPTATFVHATDARSERRAFVSANLMAAAGTWLAGLFGLLLQALVSHRFSPAAYGQVFAVFTFFTALTQPAAGFSRMIAWQTSRERAVSPGGDVESGALLRLTTRRLFITGTVIAVAFIVVARPLAGFLHVPAPYVILGAAGVPFMLSTSPLMAFLQGQERWIPWSALSAAIALSRIVFVVLFVLPFGAAGVLLGISVAAAVLYAVCLGMVWTSIKRPHRRVGWRGVWRFLVVSIASTVAVSVILGSDVFLVEHYFDRHSAGQFGAVAVTSRALLFAMGSVNSVLFPKVAARQASARSTRWVVAASLGLALVGGALGLVVFTAASHFILRAFSGPAYEGAAGYIGWYALGMPLLAGVIMLSNTQQSLADLKLLWVLAPGAVLKPLLIVLFHPSLLVVSLMSDISIGVLLLALATHYLLGERRRDVGRVSSTRPTADVLTH